MNTETVRTGSIETHKRNIRNRIAVLTMRKLFGGLTKQEVQELKDLQAKLMQMERQS